MWGHIINLGCNWVPNFGPTKSVGPIFGTKFGTRFGRRFEKKWGAEAPHLLLLELAAMGHDNLCHIPAFRVLYEKLGENVERLSGILSFLGRTRE